MNKPINRTTTQIADNKYKLYDKSAPINYKKPDGTFAEIDFTFNDTTSTIGDISLMNKGVLSVGKRKGDNPHKAVGIRPDNNQHLGTQQLEFSLINVEIDGESQDFNVETDLEIKLNIANVMQLVKIKKDFNDCKIEFDIHSKNLELINKKYTENTILRDYTFNLIKLGKDTGINIIKNHTDYILKEKDYPHIDCLIAQITDDYIMTGEYSKEEEFGDSDLSSFTINEDFYPNGSSVYFKDCIMMYCKSYNIDNIENIFLSHLKNDFNFETIWEGGKNGMYLTKDGKKVAGYESWGEQFFIFINTKELPSNIKSMFKRKTFNDTSYWDITLEYFESYIENIISKELKVELDNTYYEPIDNKFLFKINNENIFIREPIAFDEQYNNLNYYTTHSLKENEDGSYRYTKLLKIESALSYNTAKYIDVNLTASNSSTDLRTQYPGSSSSSASDKFNETWWNTARNAYGTSSTNTGNRITGANDGTSCFNGNCTYSWRVYQVHYNYDTSGVTDSVTTAKHIGQMQYVDSYFDLLNTASTTNLRTLKSFNPWTSGAVTPTWNRFTSSTIPTNWTSSDVTTYDDANTTLTQGANSTVSSIEVNLNSTAKTDIQNDSTFKYAFIDANWLSNTRATNISQRNGISELQLDDSTISNRPYLEVTTGTVSTPTENATFFGANF